FVNERQQLVRSVWIARINGVQQLSNVGHLGHNNESQCRSELDCVGQASLLFQHTFKSRSSMTCHRKTRHPNAGCCTTFFGVLGPTMRRTRSASRPNDAETGAAGAYGGYVIQ